MKKLREIIKEYKDANKLSLRDFGDMCGLSHSYIDKLEKGFDPRSKKEVEPTLPVIASIASAVGMSNKELLTQIGFLEEDTVDKSYYYLTVKGDSMIEDGIYEGDLALIREQDHVPNGDIAAVIIDNDETTLKHVYKTEDGIILQSSNPTYPPMTFAGEKSNNVKIIGRLQEIKRKY